VCEATLPANSHAGNFLSPLIRHENGGSVPALILCKFLGNNESMRSGFVGSGKADFVSSGYRKPLPMWKQKRLPSAETSV
jgi:hypothetical protein